MNDVVEALTETVGAVCRRFGDEEPAWNPRLWAELEQIGVTLPSVPEEHGGAGADLVTTVEVLRTLGRHSAAVPLAETTLLAGWLLAGCGADVPSGPLTAAVAPPQTTLRREEGAWSLSGVLHRVPWARHAAGVAVLAGHGDRLHVAFLLPDEFESAEGANLAGEPRDTVLLHGATVPDARVLPVPPGSPVTPQAFAERGALARTALMSGAMERAVELSVRYAGERVQFGRPLAKFQAVQAQLAEMAGETLLATVAAQAAARAADAGPGASLPIAAAKAAVSAAAGTVCRLAHQVHGAIGFTDEHGLRHSTTRLWAWRDEFGNEAEWGGRLGGRALDAGGRGLWPMLTGNR